MKLQSNWLLVLCMLFLVHLEAQNLSFSPYSGIVFPSGKFSEISENGLNIGLSMDKIIYKNLGLGIHINHQSLAIKAPDNLSFINGTNISKDIRSDLSTNAILLGPILKIGQGKFSFNVFSKAGVSFTNIDESFIKQIDALSSEDIFKIDQQNLTSFSVISGVKMNYKLSDNISVFISPSYLFNNNHLDVYKKNISGNAKLNSTDNFATNCFIQPSTYGVNGGITFSLGNKKEENALSDNCFPTVLTYPVNKETFSLKSENKPIFEWKNADPSVKSYELLVFADDELIYKKTTKKSSITEVNTFQKYLLKNNLDEKNFRWQVKTNYINCRPSYSQKHQFNIIKTGKAIEILYIKCLDPAFDSLGNARYTAKVRLSNLTTSLLPWEINDILLVEDNITIPIQGIYSCTPPSITSSIISIPPNTSQDWCFDFGVPIGTLSQTFQINGMRGSAVSTEGQKKDLKSCVCNICEETNEDGWQIISTDTNFWKLYSGNGKTSMGLRSAFQILNSARIQQVTAEITSVEYDANDLNCYSCPNSEDQMGLFHQDLPFSGKISPSAGWQNNGSGYNAFDKNASPQVHKYITKNHLKKVLTLLIGSLKTIWVSIFQVLKKQFN